MLRVLDAVLKAVPVDLIELRLADDLGGRALAIVDGRLPDVQECLDMAPVILGDRARVLGSSLLPRLDETLREVLGAGTTFQACRAWEPVGAEKLEDG
jgi:microcompartment protein CcmL/EutN